jgi:hypothetical protein
VFGGAFRMLHVGGALMHVWGIGWCLEAWSFGIGALEVYKCTFGCCKY